MKVSEQYLRKIYLAFGWKARNQIEDCVEKIINTLESMSKDDKDAIFTVLDPEVKKAIDDN